MKEYKKTALIAALALIVSGILIISVTSLFAVGNNISIPFFRTDNPVSSENYNYVTREILENFDNIIINEVDAKVKILPSESNSCKIKFKNSKIITRSYSIENGTLTFTAEESGNFWDHIGIFFDSPVTEIYLPKEKYDKIHIETVSGNIETTTKLVANSFHTITTSGYIHIYNLYADSFSAKSTSGEIELGKSVIRYSVINGTSGGFYASGCNFSILHCDMISGYVLLSNSKTEGSNVISVVSGNITFDNYESGYIKAETVSGDINGTFSKPMDIYVESTSGNVNIHSRDPKGPSCNLSTVSGNIIIH